MAKKRSAPTPPPEKAPMKFGKPRQVAPTPPAEFRSAIDMVRDPNFESVMAQQNYANFIADQNARMEANRANSRMAPTPPPEQGSIGAVPPTQERLKELEIFNKMVRGETLTPEELQQRKIQERKQVPLPPPERGQYTQGRLMGAPTNQMYDYNNLLQQGIQNSNTMNQGAMTNFANMQPSAQAIQPATQNPAIPVAGIGMQQPRQTSAPRKFSTVKSPSIKFG